MSPLTVAALLPGENVAGTTSIGFPLLFSTRHTKTKSDNNLITNKK